MNAKTEFVIRNLLAYKDEMGNEYLDFYENLYEEDFPDYVNGLKETGIEKFTVSARQANVADCIAAFQALGCKLEGLTKVFNKHRKHRNAFLMSVQ